MLSVLLLEQDDIIPHLVKFYAPGAKRVLDCTYGKGTLVRSLEGVQVYGSDLLPLQTKATDSVVRANFGYLPFADKSFDVTIYDPPYLYGKQSTILYERSDTDWQPQHTMLQKPDDFLSLVSLAAPECLRVSSLCFAKVMNSRIKGVLVDNKHMINQSFTNSGWTLLDELIYVRLGVGVFRNRRTAQVAHGYYLVFKA